MYELWVVRPDKSEELLETFEFEYQVDFVCMSLTLPPQMILGVVSIACV